LLVRVCVGDALRVQIVLQLAQYRALEAKLRDLHTK